jgi:hypothetical protein
MVCFVVHNHSLLYKWLFLEVKIAVFYLSSPLFIWDAAKVSCI